MSGTVSNSRNQSDEALLALLPWESDDAFLTLKDALLTEHRPVGATELALVDRLASIIIKRQRIRLAERALHLSQLTSHMGQSSGRAVTRRATITEITGSPSVKIDDAVCNDAEADDEIRTYYADENADLAKAIAILESDQTQAAFDAAITCLRDDTLEWWANVLADEEASEGVGDIKARSERLRSFLVGSIQTEMDELTLAVEQRPAARLQAWGQSLDPIRHMRLLTLDGELDRQFERTLGMLIKLKELRGTKNVD